MNGGETNRSSDFEYFDNYICVWILSRVRENSGENYKMK